MIKKTDSFASPCHTCPAGMQDRVKYRRARAEPPPNSQKKLMIANSRLGMGRQKSGKGSVKGECYGCWWLVGRLCCGDLRQARGGAPDALAAPAPKIGLDRGRLIPASRPAVPRDSRPRDPGRRSTVDGRRQVLQPHDDSRTWQPPAAASKLPVLNNPLQPRASRATLSSPARIRPGGQVMRSNSHGMHPSQPVTVSRDAP
jgi:hypothetical protein